MDFSNSFGYAISFYYLLLLSSARHTAVCWRSYASFLRSCASASISVTVRASIPLASNSIVMYCRWLISGLPLFIFPWAGLKRAKVRIGSPLLRLSQPRSVAFSGFHALRVSAKLKCKCPR
jgi:hypothetical protein